MTRAPHASRLSAGAVAADDDSLGAAASHAAEFRIERQSTAALVSEKLRDLITRGDLPPGTRLRENALAELLGVSRNTVREALRLLDHEGLVDYHVHRGVMVRTLSESDVHDLYRAREAIEVAALSYLEEAPSDAVERLDAVVTDAEAAAATGDWKTVATLDIVFHQQIVELIASPRLDTYFRRVVAELRLGFAAIDPPEHERFVRWNRLLVDLLHARMVDDCTTELRTYLASAEQMIQRALGNSE